MSTREQMSSPLASDQSHNPPVDASEPAVTIINYAWLIEFHIDRRRLDADGNERPESSLNNEQSIISGWLAAHGFGHADPVGEELGIRFNECLSSHLTSLSSMGLAKQTVSDRKCVLKKFHESFLELERTRDLHSDFGQALKHLMSRAGILANELSRQTSIAKTTIWNWIKHRQVPSRSSLENIRKLERFFKVPLGTLSSKLPDAIWIKGPRRRGTTRWRSHQGEMVRLKYRLRELPDHVQDEWRSFVRFCTDTQWADEQGLKTNCGWRIRWNNGRCVTADIQYGFLRAFFGFLCQPVDASDERVVGLGFLPQGLSLALLSDADLVIKFLYFLKGRSVTKSFNTGTLTFISLCTMLIRKKTGYLWQLPGFGAKLSQPIAESDWQAWCKKNHKKLRKFRKRIKKKRKNAKNTSDQVRRTRDPFEAVIDIIRERQHPITILFDLSKRLESLVPQMENGSKRLLAVQWRSIFQVRLIASNPLRIENFSMMTFIPKDFHSFGRACELYQELKDRKQMSDLSQLYIETTDESNLYQQKDGSWRLRFNERDFKNEKGEDIEEGVKQTPYNVAIVPSVWPSLMEYLFRQRAVLNESLRDALEKRLAERALSALTPEEELAIFRCCYVFRPCSSGALSAAKDELNLKYCTSQFSPDTMSRHILSLTTKYLPETKGFSANACRHLVASDYIKNHPNRYEEAAVALHNTAEIVRKHYSWVEVSDLIKPWSNYHEEIKGKHDRGEI